MKPVIYAIEVDRLRATGCIAGKCQLALPHQIVNQAGFSNVTSPEKSDLRKTIAGKIGGTICASFEFRFQVYYIRGDLERGRGTCKEVLLIIARLQPVQLKQVRAALGRLWLPGPLPHGRGSVRTSTTWQLQRGGQPAHRSQCTCPVHRIRPPGEYSAPSP